MALSADILIEQTHRAGCQFMVDGERVGLRGDPAITAELAPRLRPYKHALLRVLRERQRQERKAWRISIPGRAPFELICVQGCTRAELQTRYPAATAIEPTT